MKNISRREFAATGALTFLPSRVLGRGREPPPSKKLNLAFMGIGMAGGTQINELSSQNIVARCGLTGVSGPRFPQS